MTPDCGLTKEITPGVKGVKNCLTYSMCGNAYGSDILPPFVIGKSAMPQAFNKKTGAQLDFCYHSNAKAWMTSAFFEEWLQEWNKKLRHHNQHILLWLDNFSGHTVPATITNIHVELFSPNLISHVQPMDAGIIRYFKAHYCRLFIACSIDRYDASIHPFEIFKINQLEAMHLADIAWSHVTPEVHHNCWRKAGILPSLENAPAHNDSTTIPTPNLAMSIDNLLNPLQLAEDALTTELDLLMARGCLLQRNWVDLEELLNPEGEHGSCMKTCTDVEIIKLLQGKDFEGDVHDNQEEAEPLHLVTHKEALQAAEILKRFASDHIEDWACKLEGILIKMTQETHSVIAKRMHSTEITNYFTPKLS